MEKTYWLDLFSPETWQEVAKIGYTITGFRQRRWNVLTKTRPGDVFICYLTGVSRFCGLLEVASPPYRDETPIWKSNPFSARVRTVPLVTLQPTYAIPFDNLVAKLGSATSWRGYIRGSPMKLPAKDALVIEEALLTAAKTPKEYPLASKSLKSRSGRTAKGDTLAPKAPLLAVPPKEELPRAETQRAGEATSDDIQAILVEIGLGMGLDVWVGRDSRNKVVNGLDFARLCLDSLPQQFDPSTTKIIEYIDVLWLDGNAITAAFEVEHTTSIYSGLLRMSDLVSMQPNINIPLYIVAADEKREKVRQEINRPTFRMLRRPIVDICRYISYDKLTAFYRAKRDELSFLRPEIVRERLAEDCH